MRRCPAPSEVTRLAPALSADHKTVRKLTQQILSFSDHLPPEPGLRQLSYGQRAKPSALQRSVFSQAGTADDHGGPLSEATAEEFVS